MAAIYTDHPLVNGYVDVVIEIYEVYQFIKEHIVESVTRNYMSLSREDCIELRKRYAHYDLMPLMTALVESVFEGEDSDVWVKETRRRMIDAGVPIRNVECMVSESYGYLIDLLSEEVPELNILNNEDITYGLAEGYKLCIAFVRETNEAYTPYTRSFRGS